MSDISKIQIEENIYNIKDEQARTNISNINDDIVEINNKINKNKKYVFMGDSYGDGYSPDGDVTSWINLLIQKLNLQPTDYISTHQGGYGFAYSSANNFINLLNNLSNDNNLTDMYVCGGYNDLNASENDILLGIQNFNTLFKQKFPNAKLHIGFIGWTKNGTNIRKLANVFMYYKKACNFETIDFLNGCEYALHNYFKYFSSDGIHPNQTGQNSIANALFECMANGKANVVEKEGLYFSVDGTINNSNTSMILKNGVVSAFINGGSQNSISITFTETKTQTGNTPLEIATITNSLLVGTDYNDIVFQGVNCVVFNGTNYSKAVLDFIIKNGKIYVVNSGATGGNYQAITIKSLQIPAMHLTVNGLCG